MQLDFGTGPIPMPLDLLKKALAVARGSRLVIVTDELFWQLYDAMELSPRKVGWRAPQDPACEKIMNTLLARHHLPRADQLTEVTWHLTQHGSIRVIRGLPAGRVLNGQPVDFEILQI
jgi:hypothetical protein